LTPAKTVAKGSVVIDTAGGETVARRSTGLDYSSRLLCLGLHEFAHKVVRDAIDNH
jgi:hypothetical protein